MVQAAVSPDRMIVFVDVFSQQPIEIPLIERDYMIEKIAPEYSDYPLSEWILLMRPISCPYGLDAGGDQEPMDGLWVLI